MVLHNPNNWHWVDKNCIQWSRDYFEKKLPGLSAIKGDVSAEITDVKQVDGDVDVCQRKGKVISLFDLSIEAAYKGKVGETEVTGRIKVPEVAYDTEEDEYQFNISIDGETPDKEPVKALVRSELVPKLRKALKQFGVDLIDTHGKDIQHPDQVAAANAAAAGNTGSGTAAREDKSVVGTNEYNTTTLTLKPVFTAPADQLYKVFLDKQLLAAWTRAAPNLDPVVGGKYSLFNGNITGEIKQLKPNELIEMSWRLKDWKPNHYATLKLDFSQGTGETTLNVTWSGIPVGQEEVVETNFQNYYVRPIMLTFGYGLP